MKKQVKQEGAEFLRDLVKWLNQRSEVLNENKSPLTLINEYRNIHNHVRR
jgi:hypothetical protein